MAELELENAAVINIKILLMGALVNLETRLKVPILTVFDNFGHFPGFLFWHKHLALNTDFFTKISSMYGLSCLERDFLVISSSGPIIHTMQARFS